MSHLASAPRTLSSHQIATAAEAYVAAQFALCGFDVLEHAGRANFHYDLGVARAEGMMKIAVHASFNGFWDLADRCLDASRGQSFSSDDYHCAIDEWQEQHSEGVVCCLVEFESTGPNQMPHIYLAYPSEVAAAMHDRIDDLGAEQAGAHGLDLVHSQQGFPGAWRLSEGRILDMMLGASEEAAVGYEYARIQQAEEHAATAVVELVRSAFLIN